MCKILLNAAFQLLLLINVNTTDYADFLGLSMMLVATHRKQQKLECGPMPNLMVALPNIGGALCSTPQTLADAHY